MDRIKSMRAVQALMLATSFSLGVAACGSESTPPPAKASGSTEVGGNPSSPNSSPSSSVKNQAASVKLNAKNVRLNYEVTTQYGAIKGKESEIVAISGDSLSIRTNGTGSDGKPDNGYAKLSPSSSVFCKKTCQSMPAALAAQLRKISVPQFTDPLSESSMYGFAEKPTITPAPDETIHGIEAKCFTLRGMIFDGPFTGKLCAAVNGGFLVLAHETTHEGTTDFELQSVRAALPTDFPSH